MRAEQEIIASSEIMYAILQKENEIEWGRVMKAGRL